MGAGRPVGSKSSRTIAWERLGQHFTGKFARRAIRIMSKMDDKEFMQAYEKMLKYFRPSLQSVQADMSIGLNDNLDLTDEELESRIKKLITIAKEGADTSSRGA